MLTWFAWHNANFFSENLNIISVLRQCYLFHSCQTLIRFIFTLVGQNLSCKIYLVSLGRHKLYVCKPKRNQIDLPKHSDCIPGRAIPVNPICKPQYSFIIWDRFPSVFYFDRNRFGQCCSWYIWITGSGQYKSSCISLARSWFWGNLQQFSKIFRFSTEIF